MSDPVFIETGPWAGMPPTPAELDAMTPNPAYRHGGPDAGWYRRTMDGWRRISDTEAANGRYEDMRHFMHDPDEDDHE